MEAKISVQRSLLRVYTSIYNTKIMLTLLSLATYVTVTTCSYAYLRMYVYMDIYSSVQL